MTSSRWPLQPPSDPMQETGMPTGQGQLQGHVLSRIDVDRAWPGQKPVVAAIRDYHVEAIYMPFW